MDFLNKPLKKEYLYFSILTILLIAEKFFVKDYPHIHWHELLFFINYVATAIFIGYFLLPKFLYKKKHFRFAIYTTISIGISVIIEEFVLEQIYFPDDRGSHFDLLFTLYDILPNILILVGFKFAWDATQKQNKIDKLDKIVIESQLKYLNSQINPHFLFNNLNNLYALALEQSPKTPESILGLSAILRYMIYECREDEVFLNKEIEHLEHYIQLYQLQLDTRAKVQFEKEISEETAKVSPLILIIFVENAFKHSSSSQLEEIKIDIRITTENKRLIFECINNFREETNLQNIDKGVGLSNVKERLELIYKDEYSLNIEKKEQKYVVNLSLPLSYD